jgi:rhodanese-related sulfurtransferase
MEHAMSGLFRAKLCKDLKPQGVHEALKTGEVVLIDVREPHEFAAERIEGALPFPLSSFDPSALPAAEGRRIVMQCGSGMRSAKAVDLCQRAGLEVDRHLAGGINAWKMAGLPTISGPAKP